MAGVYNFQYYLMQCIFLLSQSRCS